MIRVQSKATWSCVTGPGDDDDEEEGDDSDDEMDAAAFFIIFLHPFSSSSSRSSRYLRNSEQSCWEPGANQGGLDAPRNSRGAYAAL